MKANITKSEYLQLLGLMSLAREGKRGLERIQAAMLAIFDVKVREFSKAEDRINDVWWGADDFTVDGLLEALSVTVVDDPDPAPAVDVEALQIDRDELVIVLREVNGFSERLPARLGALVTDALDRRRQ